MSKLNLRAAMTAAAGILLTIGGCADVPTTPGAAQFEKLRAPSSASFSQAGSSDRRVIGPEGGKLQTAEGHSIVFPAGALSRPTEISMTAVAGYVGVNLEPHGLRFPAGREPVLTLNASGATAEYDVFSVLYVDDAGNVLEVLPARVRGEKLTTRLQHFSGYIGGGQKDTENSVCNDPSCSGITTEQAGL